MVNPADYTKGDRVRAVDFALDEGLRIWPVAPEDDRWRVVQVADQRVEAELFSGGQLDCQAKYPEAVFGINDNESVPPGTEGTVTDVTSGGQVGVSWDNGRRLFCAPEDTIEKIVGERPYAVILKIASAKCGRLTVRILATGRDDAMRVAEEIYGGKAIAAQHHPMPLQ